MMLRLHATIWEFGNDSVEADVARDIYELVGQRLTEVERVQLQGLSTLLNYYEDAQTLRARERVND